MKTLTLAVAIAATALASPALAQNVPITVSFTEAADDDSTNPAAIVTGTDAFSHSEDGERTSVTLTNYFGNTERSDGTVFLYNLLEPATGAISDQIKFTKADSNLIIDFISDPARFISSDQTRSITETGNYQTVFSLSGDNEFGLRGLTVRAASETETRPVPEPATWAMMLLGFGGIGFAMRRKRAPAMLQIA